MSSYWIDELLRTAEWKTFTPELRMVLLTICQRIEAYWQTLMEEAEKNSLPKLSGKNARRGKMDTKESRDLAIESALSQLNLHTALGLDDFVAIRKAIAGEGRLRLIPLEKCSDCGKVLPAHEYWCERQNQGGE